MDSENVVWSEPSPLQGWWERTMFGTASDLASPNPPGPLAQNTAVWSYNTSER